MDSVVIQSAPASKEAPPASPAAGDKPAFLPDKFWKDGKADFEGLAKSYAELEKVKPAPSQQTPEEIAAAAKAAEELAAGKPQTLEAAKPEMSEIPGVTKSAQEAATKELAETGALSAETYAALEKAGYKKATVDQYIKGIQADQENGARTVTEMKAITGGTEQYDAMIGWMTASLQPAEIEGYNKAMNSRDNAMIELAIRGMHSKYVKANGSDPTLLGGSGNGGTGGAVYANWAQVTAAMADHKYKSDDAYRKQVSDQLARSSI